MRLLIYLKDGRTVYRIEGRGKLKTLLDKDGTSDDRSLTVGRGIWNPQRGEFMWTEGIRLRGIAKGSISHVEEARYGDSADEQGQ